MLKMEFKEENKKLLEAKNKLRKKFEKDGLNKEQIDKKLTKIDVDFLLHSFVNNTLKNATTEERLKFYIKYLENEK